MWFVTNPGNSRGPKHTARINASSYSTQSSQSRTYEVYLTSNEIWNILISLLYLVLNYEKLYVESKSLGNSSPVIMFQRALTAITRKFLSPNAILNADSRTRDTLFYRGSERRSISAVLSPERQRLSLVYCVQ